MRLIPKTAGWELKEVIEMFKDVAADNDLNFNGNLPIDIAQEFVDAEYILRDEMADESEEDFVDSRDELIHNIILTKLHTH